MKCYKLLVHGKLDWSPEAVRKWHVPDTRPSGFYCTRFRFARSREEATAKVLEDVRTFYEQTTDWFVHDLLELGLEIEEISRAPFYLGLKKPNHVATFYP